jgi:type III pantothenate kinase
MLLAIDIGNSNIVYGAYEDDRLIAHWRDDTPRQINSATYLASLDQLLHGQPVTPEQLEAAVISSVVPELQEIIPAAIHTWLKVDPLIVGPNLKTGLKLNYDQPKKLGTDRLANAVAAFTLYGGPVIILDCGTATKLEAITEDGTFLGGIIAPGVRVAATALTGAAAQLDAFKLTKPPTVIGTNTTHCMQSGFIYGHIMMLHGLIERIRMEMKAPSAPVVATGGLIGLLADPLLTFEYINPFLTLDGLRIIHEMNS